MRSQTNAHKQVGEHSLSWVLEHSESERGKTVWTTELENSTTHPALKTPQVAVVVERERGTEII